MVRVNIINPKYLTDQHLIAEYYEILILAGYTRDHCKKHTHPVLKDIPKHYCLGKGHMKFFRNKIKYLKSRHEQIRKEMKRRGFNPKIKMNLKGFRGNLLRSWRPGKQDIKVIQKRLIWKIRLKPKYYRYYGKHKPLKFFVGMVGKAG